MVICEISGASKIKKERFWGLGLCRISWLGGKKLGFGGIFSPFPGRDTCSILLSFRFGEEEGGHSLLVLDLCSCVWVNGSVLGVLLIERNIYFFFLFKPIKRGVANSGLLSELYSSQIFVDSWG